MNYSAVGRLTVAPELALEFLAMFSRLEFALKATGFVQSGNREAKADWHRFADAVAASFDPSRTPQTMAAFTRLTAQPVRYLGVHNKALVWLPYNQRGASNSEQIVGIIKLVRNNLFHGGKFALDLESTQERDSELLNASIILMCELIPLAQDVEAAYLS